MAQTSFGDFGFDVSTTEKQARQGFRDRYGAELSDEDFLTFYGGGNVNVPDLQFDHNGDGNNMPVNDETLKGIRGLTETNAAGPQLGTPGGGDLYKWEGTNVPLPQYQAPTAWDQQTAFTSPTGLAGTKQPNLQEYGGFDLQAFAPSVTSPGATNTGLTGLQNQPLGAAPTAFGGPGTVTPFTNPFTANQALQGLQQAPTQTAGLQTDLRSGVTGALTGETPLPALAPLMDALQQRQADESQALMDQLGFRGITGSTIADEQRSELARAQNNEMANITTQALSQLLPMQTNVLSQLESGEREGRNQQIGELMQSLGLGEQLQAGGFGRGLAGQQQGLAEQAQQFGQGLQGRQQGVGELMGAVQALQQQQAQEFGQGLAGRQQGVAEQAQTFGQKAGQRGEQVSQMLQGLESEEALRQGQFGRDVGAYQIGAQDQLNQYAQGMQGRQQGLSEFFQFLNAQMGLDQQAQQQQAQGLGLMLNAMGQATTTPNLPQFGVPAQQPSAMQSLGTIAGNIGPALIDKYGG